MDFTCHSHVVNLPGVNSATSLVWEQGDIEVFADELVKIAMELLLERAFGSYTLIQILIRYRKRRHA